jgi:drug/metabolite transporter (DMT)-like permease
MIAPAPASRRSLLIASYVAVCVIWGSTYLGIAVALESFPPFFLGGLRFIVAGGLMLTVARLRGEPWPERAQWRGALVTAALMFVVGNGLVNAAERSLSSSAASVLAATMPLWMTIFGRLLGERVTGREMVGVALGFVGVAVMNLGSELRASPAGAIMVLCAALGWALGALASRRLPNPPGIMRVGAQMLGGGVMMALISLGLGERLHAMPSTRSLLAALYLFVFGSLIGFSAFSYLLKHTRAAIASSYAYVNPVIGVLLGVFVAGESFSLASGVGAVIIVASIVMVGLARAAAAPSAREPAPASAAEVPPLPASPGETPAPPPRASSFPDDAARREEPGAATTSARP